MLWYLIIIVSVLWAAFNWWQGRKIRNAVKQFPSNIPSYPLVGHALHCIGSDEDRMETFKKVAVDAIQSGGISHFWLGARVYLIVTDPEAAEVLLKNCLEKDQITQRFGGTFFGDGLLFAKVNIWRPRRKVLAPLFSQRNLNEFARVFAEKSAVMVQQLQPAANGLDVSIWKYFTTYTFDSLCQTSLGVNMNSQKLKTHPFIDALEEITSLIAQRGLKPWLHPDFVYSLMPQFKRFNTLKKYCYEFVEKIIENKRIEMAENNTSIKSSSNSKNNNQTSFLEMMIKARSGGENGCDNVELREEVMVLIVAGTDTSAVGASFAAVMLSRYQDEQTKVYEEIQEVFGDSDRLLQPEDLPKLQYLEVFLKETLRLYPPGPVIVRSVHHDFKLPSGKDVVAGENILLHIWGMHRNPRYWGEDAEQFRPERFLAPLRHPAQFVPFSYGMRNCLGYQYAMTSMKAALASLVRRYRVLPPAGMAPSALKAPLRVKHSIMMKHVEEYVVRLEPRR